MDAVQLTNISKTYDNGVQALKGINLNISEGDFFALLGANGAGKTTLIGVLTGLVNKSSGSAKIFGYDLETHSNTVKRHIGVVPQEFNFSIFEKVIDIIVWQAGYFGIPRSEAESRAEEILTHLDLWKKKDMYSRTLSGGMKRRLMIARALIHKPKLLILDEPTAGVDVELRLGMWEYLQKINQEGTTIILTTHYLEEAEQLCKNLAIIKQGEIVKADSVKNLLSTLEKESYIVDTSKLPSDIILKNYQTTVLDDNSFEIVVGKNEHSLNQILEDLRSENIQIQAIRPKGNRLEELFINILNTK